ncbi:MAG: sporulation protein YabP [Sulfobacillus thermosulfidooxidans]|uniref:Sporulation protein YabP n=1 Tax=Sulfobacillus thermotolerans TaxID=338644 RepID=A0ABM6RN61_9FIRM|nr:sporulation protein YabP [Sulfobacillus sp. hq2]AUW92806.1 sporulation protein YabP [Sulfobacillus thermotolerans]MCY0909508.1 sporulation protein YabP [Sulfobacillus thermotolerans]POB09953.1 sporulation protein YabP [Sulfobacillus sp. hq2]PSR37655.1 MAG: sporulation protein YabP [Sulfobacillus thermosulfidooxidans]
MAEDRHEKNRAHLVQLVNRAQLTIEGVQHVENFDDDAIILSTDMGMMTVKGRGLRILQLDLESGHFVAEGEVDALSYSRKRPGKSENTWTRLWR